MSQHRSLTNSLTRSLLMVAGALMINAAAVADPLTTITTNNDQTMAVAIQPAGSVRIRHLNLPKYSNAMVENGVEGVIEVQAHVDEAGRVTDATIARLDPPVLAAEENSVLKSVRSATFYPSSVDGKPTDSLVVVPFHFQLVDRTVSTFPFKRVAKSRIAGND